jgi:hypothetical protein
MLSVLVPPNNGPVTEKQFITFVTHGPVTEKQFITFVTHGGVNKLECLSLAIFFKPFYYLRSGL